MRGAVLICFCIVLSGCASLDPVPYDPVADTNGPPGFVLGWHASPPAAPSQIPSLKSAQSSDQASLPTWPGDLSDDAIYMRYLGASYEVARNEVLVQKPIFDFVTVAFGAAAGVNGIFEGSKVATTVLGFSAAGSAATELYFSPQTKIEAYNNGWAALDCGADVADQINEINKNNPPQSPPVPQLTLASSLSATISTLSDEIARASDALTDADQFTTTSTDDKSVLQTDEKALNAAVTAANVAILNAQNAQSLLNNADQQLEIFTDSVVKITSNKIMTGEDDSTQLLALLKTAQQGGPLSGTSSILAIQNQTAVSPPATPIVFPPTSTPPPPSTKPKFADVDDAIRAETTFLNAQSVLAQLRTDEINGVWSNLTTCALKTS